MDNKTKGSDVFKNRAEPSAGVAVDDIAAKESDALLAAEDTEAAKAFETPQLQTFKAKCKSLVALWWHNKLVRNSTFTGLCVALLLVFAVPSSRYFVLNTAGVRSAAKVMVLDEKTRQPLKNVLVGVAGKSGTTDDEGIVRLNGLKLGATELVIEKRAFAAVKEKVTLGWGSNPLGERTLTPIGAQYVFTVKDFLSGQPLEKAEATSGEGSAFSDAAGDIVLTLDKNDDLPVPVTIMLEGYRIETLQVAADTNTKTDIKMVPARKNVFISKRSGKYDIYVIDIDGKNETVVLKGTGDESEDMALLPHPTDPVAALVSTRDGKRNGDGFLLSSLMVISLNGTQKEAVVTSERIQLAGWFGKRIVYAQIAAGDSGNNPERHRLMSYNTEDGSNTELAASNYFNDVMKAGDQIFYAPSGAFQKNEAAQFFKVHADGTNRQAILDSEVWNIFRTAYTTLNVSVGRSWYEYDIESSTMTALNGPPANIKNRIYIERPDSKKSVWVDSRDGKGTLLVYDAETKKDTTLLSRSGLGYPVRWLNDSVVIVRLINDQETADYAVSLNGGDPVKIKDVTATSSQDSWYYY